MDDGAYVATIGKTKIFVQIDGVNQTVNALTDPEGVQNVPVIIGQVFFKNQK